jgi:hypothetical protein
MNLPPLDIVQPVITNAWLCYFPTIFKFSVFIMYVDPLPQAIPKTFIPL